MSSHSLFAPVNEPGTRPPQVVSLNLGGSAEVPVYIGTADANQRVSVQGMPNLSAFIDSVPVEAPEGTVPGAPQEYRSTLRPVGHVAVIDVVSLISDKQSAVLPGGRIVMSRADRDHTIVPIQALRAMKKRDPTVDANDWLDTLPNAVFITDDGVLDPAGNFAPSWFADAYVLDEVPSRVDIVMNTNVRDRGLAPVYTTQFPQNADVSTLNSLLPEGHIIVGSIGLGALPSQLPGSGVNTEIVPFNVEGPRDEKGVAAVAGIRAITTGHMVTQLVNSEPYSRVREMYKAIQQGQTDGSDQAAVSGNTLRLVSAAGMDDVGADHQLAQQPTGTDAANAVAVQDPVAGALSLSVSESTRRGRR
ncbi:MAG: hypothetical protein KIH63_005545 [Candidatus Saccharibacteria bacterium]|nr:hypothetical protein [Candidatus Saccharibacteria bacterium]